ncbi:MAG: CCA tRNA nucleotidyltransferase, partial [Nanoarchaeota archaeon]|nr:CCA tRNA nucleotidyltransferase [Nanoarchaeota archaeon]
LALNKFILRDNINRKMIKEVLSKIKPTAVEQHKFKVTISELLRKINATVKDGNAILGGSGAKDTWLAGNHDLDIFVLFPYTQYAQKSALLSDILEPQLRKIFPKTKIDRVHGSRDYFQLRVDNFNIEIVPILKISSAKKALNITYISPLHSSWVNKKAQKLKDEIRLAKQFCQAQDVYGAESYIGGFSGYVLEILIVQYGSFQKLLQAAQAWKVQDVVDTEKQYPKRDALFQMNKSKLTSPLIVVDPVDKNRNAAAALSIEKCIAFKKAAKEFLKKPQPEFFMSKKRELKHLQIEAAKRKQNLVFVEMVPLDGKKDVVGYKLKKAFHFVEQKMQPYEITESGWEWNHPKASLYFFLRKKQVPKLELRAGPPLKMTEFVAQFKKEHRKTMAKNGHIYASVQVQHPTLDDCVRNCIKQPYFKEKIQKIVQIKVV